MTTLTWLHLSDWHQRGTAFDFNRDVVHKALLGDLRQRTKINAALEQIDFIVFSGDVTYTGHKDEFTTAQKYLFDPILDAVGLKPDAAGKKAEQLFIVPGNHDLDRNTISSELLAAGLYKPLDSHDKVTDWLTKDKKLNKVLEPFEAYREFVTNYTGQESPDYATICHLMPRGKSIALLGLNSAWMCARNKDANGEVNDYGYAIVGEPQVLDPLKEIEKADIRIAVMHHPFSWLAEFDRNRVEPRLGQGCHFVLCGHQHQPQVQVIQGLSGNYIVIPAGASYNRRVGEDPLFTNAYNLVHLNFETGRGVIYFRHWSERHKPPKWVADREICDNDDGRFEFDLPKGRTRGIHLEFPEFPSPKKEEYLSGAILYVSIPQFAKLSHEKQHDAIEYLQGEINRLVKIMGADNCWLDPRGHSFLLFVKRPATEAIPATLAKTLILGWLLQTSVAEWLEARTVGRLSVVLHWEEGHVRTHELATRSYFWGPAFDEAPLLMSSSVAGHFFVSDSAYRQLPKESSVQGATFKRCVAALLATLTKGNELSEAIQQLTSVLGTYPCRWEQFTTHDQEKCRHDIHSFYVDSKDISPGSQIGSADDPLYHVPIEYRVTSAPSPDHPFVKRLAAADEVSIIALTHEGTVKWLGEALKEREKENKGFWTDLQIIFPSMDVLKRLPEEPEVKNAKTGAVEKRTVEDRCAKWEEGKKSVFTFLLGQGPACFDRWHCLEYEENLPFTGPWFVRDQESSLWVQSLLPGCDTKAIYRAELFKGMDAYEQVRSAFIFIAQKSKLVTEWNVYGRAENEASPFYYAGIVNRKRLSDRRKFHFPTVLVILHAYVEEEGDSKPRHRVLLQERTIYNAASDAGKFSNISGRVTDADVFRDSGENPVVFPDSMPDDEATKEFEKKVSLKPDKALPEGTWQQAAIREIQEELGISVSPGPDRLDHVWKVMPFEVRREDKTHMLLYFNIFSLRLSRGRTLPGSGQGGEKDEIEAIRYARPEANLHPFGLSELRDLKKEGKLNHLLNERFDDFMEIFEQLRIDE